VTKKLLTLSIAVLLCSGVLLAQRGSFERGPRMEGASATAPTDLIKTYLNLTDAQLQSLQTVQSAFRDAASPIMKQIREKSQAQREAMQQNNTALVAQLQAEIDNLRKQEQSLRSQYKLQAQNVLTGDQKAKLAALQAALDLMPAAQQASMLNLIDSAQGAGPGFGGGFRGGRGPGEAIRP
jgi:Spy/CpxP family protein refolding chaperone